MGYTLFGPPVAPRNRCCSFRAGPGTAKVRTSSSSSNVDAFGTGWGPGLLRVHAEPRSNGRPSGRIIGPERHQPASRGAPFTSAVSRASCPPRASALTTRSSKSNSAIRTIPPLPSINEARKFITGTAIATAAGSLSIPLAGPPTGRCREKQTRIGSARIRFGFLRQRDGSVCRGTPLHRADRQRVFAIRRGSGRLQQNPPWMARPLAPTR